MSDQADISELKGILLRERNALLDLSTRNRLLNIPLRTRHARLVEIVDEKAVEIHRMLAEEKAFTFLPGRMLSEEERASLDADDVETGAIPQPSEDDVDERGVARRHADLRLQTKLTSEGLQKRLFNIWYDARTLEEEQGVNILYLAVGLLRWYDADGSDIARHAPLVLIPVSLERTSASEKFKLRARPEPLATNITLQAKLRAEFGLILEDAPGEDEDFDLLGYFAKVMETVAKQPRWEVMPDAMVLGFFSFAKYLMYRDLDPDLWPEGAALDEHPLVAALLRDGFPVTEPLVADETASIDPVIPPIALNHVVDADSSQAVAIAEAAGGRTLVVKGPPGTGKSQTITNIIAAAVARGKKVLFVAEKMAALDVVYRRLKNADLGAIALELHSSKANKRSVLEELRRTEALVPRPVRGEAATIESLGVARNVLNDHANRLHAPLPPHAFTAYQILGHLLRTGAAYEDGHALAAAATWTPAERAQREDTLRNIADQLALIGLPQEHPWRGVQCEPMDRSEADALIRNVQALASELDRLSAAQRVIAACFAVPPVAAVADFASLKRLGEIALSVPGKADRASFAHPLWAENPQRLLALVEAGRRLCAAKAYVTATFAERAWGVDFAPVRRTLIEKGSNWFRIFDSGYRGQLAALRALVKAGLPRSPAERLRAVGEMIEAQKARIAYDALRASGDAFGSNWQDESSEWDALEPLVRWRLAIAGVPAGFFAGLAASDREALSAAQVGLSRGLPAFAKSLDDLFGRLDLETQQAFGVAEKAACSVAALSERFHAWSIDIGKLNRWVQFAKLCRDAGALGLSPIVRDILAGRLVAGSIFPAYEAAYFDALRAALFRELPELKAFDGEAQDKRVALFKQLDLMRIKLAREQIASKHAEGRPQGMPLRDSPLGVLKGEIAKKSRHLPIRKLLEKAGPAVQQLKPVFMMSPLSVAQFLKPGALEFDILLMDEASQIQPVDALGAIARAKQIVVVGDERQLPPTRFFAKLTGDDEDRDEDGPSFEAKDVESILELCLAKGAPYRLLNWHYRSKHQSLIAVSNREFYESRLFIIPSPYDATAGMGLKFRYLPDARYDRGNSRTNQIEARAVAEAVIRHARETPDQSLGVAAFSVAQRGAILKELELLRRADSGLEPFFRANAAEPFFVKNLENIQGDERDVIFISVGYGKNENGYMAMNFGPLSSDGGERRLNVLISRAKLRCEIFSSITADDIDLERGRARGVAAFKLFLRFAQTGKFDLGDAAGRGHDSIFEEQVAGRLKSLGHDVRSQIGTAGFFVDLAISDPDKPGRYVLGIECDGAQYHASRSARDRDRLRQLVLEDHGWIIHRIWSADWYLRPDEELKKVEAKIADAKAVWRARDEELAKPRRAAPVSIDFEEVWPEEAQVAVSVDMPPARPAGLSVPYKEARFSVDRALDPHEVSAADMVAVAVRIVDLEGPIHIDEIVQRVRILWGLGRAGARIRSTVERAVGIACRQGLLKGEEFLAYPGREARIRDRSEVASLSLRRPEHLPPAEIDQAIMKLVAVNFGAGRDSLLIGTSRLFGFAAMSAQLRAALEARLEVLLCDGKLSEKDGYIGAVEAG